MNSERVSRLLEHLKSIDDDQFCYKYTFTKHAAESQRLGSRYGESGIVPECGTPGCVAGHAIMLFRDELGTMPIGRGRSVICDAARLLGISPDSPYSSGGGDASRLFVSGSSVATKKHAVARLEYLLENGNLERYDFDSESH